MYVSENFVERDGFVSNKCIIFIPTTCGYPALKSVRCSKKNYNRSFYERESLRSLFDIIDFIFTSQSDITIAKSRITGRASTLNGKTARRVCEIGKWGKSVAHVIVKLCLYDDVGDRELGVTSKRDEPMMVLRDSLTGVQIALAEPVFLD